MDAGEGPSTVKELLAELKDTSGAHGRPRLRLVVFEDQALAREVESSRTGCPSTSPG